MNEENVTLISKEYAESVFTTGPVIKEITSSDGSVSVFVDGPKVDLKVKSGGGSDDGDNIKYKSFCFTCMDQTATAWPDIDGIITALINKYGYRHAAYHTYSSGMRYFDDWESLSDAMPYDENTPIYVRISTAATLQDILDTISANSGNLQVRAVWPAAGWPNE